MTDPTKRPRHPKDNWSVESFLIGLWAGAGVTVVIYTGMFLGFGCP